MLRPYLLVILFQIHELLQDLADFSIKTKSEWQLYSNLDFLNLNIKLQQKHSESAYLHQGT